MIEFIVSNIKKVENYISAEIGVEFESTMDDPRSGAKTSGTILVFDLELNEVEKIKEFCRKLQ